MTSEDVSRSGSAGTVESAAASRLLQEVERQAVIRSGLIRSALAVVLLVVTWAIVGDLPAGDVVTLQQVRAWRFMIAAFGLTGLAIVLLARAGIATRGLPYLTVALDAVLVLGNLAFTQVTTDAPGNVTFVFPAVWLVPIALAANAIYFRPGLQAFATLIYVAGILGISSWAGYLPAGAMDAALVRLDVALSGPPNVLRILLLLSGGLLLVLAASHGRRILERAVRETTLRLNLTRYLPGELAPVLSDDALAELRAGKRLRIALLFVDIRESSVRAAGMDPTALARFISAFRARVGRAAAQHGGIIDKFIGDGALIVFGVPRPGETEAARALACAATLVDLIGRWNVKRGFEPRVDVGIGLHCGEVFCGVVGEEERLEFTVLGDAVNIAARLESATKRLGGPILASREIVEAAGLDMAGWRHVSSDPLPGMVSAISILAPSHPTRGPLAAEGKPA